jgi:NitT/TauT family transport system permease protein
VIDPFRFNQPSAVWGQIVTWTTQGASQGSLGAQILVT